MQLFKILKKNLAILKILATCLVFYLVFKKINIWQLIDISKKCDLTYLFFSFLALFFSQTINSLRMRYYFLQHHTACSKSFAFALYWLSMFYNNILPGGIGGDGYKIYIMNKIAKLPKLASFRLALSNRANGLYWLININLALLAFYDFNLKLWLLAAFIMISIAYFCSFKYLLKETLLIAFGASYYSVLIQLLSLLSAYFLFTALKIEQENMLIYLIIFMISNICSIIPISLGTAGLRELSFVYSCQYFCVPAEVGVAFAMLYYTSNLVLSISGLAFISKINKLY